MKKQKSDKHRADVAQSLHMLEILFGRKKPPDQNKTPLLAGKGAVDTAEQNTKQAHDSTAADDFQAGGA